MCETEENRSDKMVPYVILLNALKCEFKNSMKILQLNKHVDLPMQSIFSNKLNGCSKRDF